MEKGIEIDLIASVHSFPDIYILSLGFYALYQRSSNLTKYLSWKWAWDTNNFPLPLNYE